MAPLEPPCSYSPAWSQPQAQPDEQHLGGRVPLLQPRQVALPKLRPGQQLARANARPELAGGDGRELPKLQLQAELEDQRLQTRAH
jgi:hypothetical protein